MTLSYTSGSILSTEIRAQKGRFLRLLGRALVLPSCLGAVPFTLRGSSVVVVPWKMVYSVFCTSLVLLMVVYASVSPNPLLSRSTFSMFVFGFQAVTFSLTTFACLYSVTAYRRQINISIAKLIKVDKILYKLNATPKLKYTHIYGIASILTVATFALVHILWLRNANPTLLVMFLTWQVGQIYFYGVLELMVFLIDQIWYYLDEVVRRATPRETALVQLCTVHDLLADVSTGIGKVYGLPALCISLSCFTYLNVCIFIGIKRAALGELFLYLGWSVIICIPLLRMANSCGGTTRKGNEFYPVLYKIMKRDTSGKLLSNVYLNAHLLKKKSFVFNAAGFSNLDLRYLGGILAATASYTVILIQMGTDF